MHLKKRRLKSNHGTDCRIFDGTPNESQSTVGQHRFTSRAIRGGSPQGCVSANALFCATIEHLQDRPYEDDIREADLADIKAPGTSTLYAGNTTLIDVPSDEEETPYCTPSLRMATNGRMRNLFRIMQALFVGSVLMQS